MKRLLDAGFGPAGKLADFARFPAAKAMAKDGDWA